MNCSAMQVSQAGLGIWPAETFEINPAFPVGKHAFFQ